MVEVFLICCFKLVDIPFTEILLLCGTIKEASRIKHRNSQDTLNFLRKSQMSRFLKHNTFMKVMMFNFFSWLFLLFSRLGVEENEHIMKKKDNLIRTNWPAVVLVQRNVYWQFNYVLHDMNCTIDRDGNIPISYVQKYLTVKLELSSEDEVTSHPSWEMTCINTHLPYNHSERVNIFSLSNLVWWDRAVLMFFLVMGMLYLVFRIIIQVEIKCMGQTLIPTLTLNNLYDLWLQTTTNERVSATIGSSAKDFVMVLGYARKEADS